MTTSSRLVGPEEGGGWTCEDAFDYVRDRFRHACRDLRGQPTIDWILIGGTAYSRALLVDDVHWLRFRAREVEEEVVISPESLLTTLRAATRETERIGEEDVRGVPTVRYRLTVSCEEARIDDCPDGTEAVDVWIDNDGLLRRLSGAQSALEWDVELVDFGVQLEIEPPPESDAVPDASGQCTHDTASPVLVGQATEALRRQGFDVAVDVDTRSDQWACFESVAAHLTNAHDQHPVWGAPHRADGVLNCTLYGARRAGEGSFVFPVFPSGRTPDPVDREFQNVHCLLFVEGPRADERTEHLDAAFDELRREVGG